jgi:hypothetical protein
MLKFSIRDLLWLTLAVALALGWFIRERTRGGPVESNDSAACQALLRDVYAAYCPTRSALLGEEFSRQTDGWCRVENAREILLFNVKEKKFTILRGVDPSGGRHERYGVFFFSHGELRARLVGESY